MTGLIRYEMLALGNLSVRMDKFTGETEMLMADGWRPMSKEGWSSAQAPKPRWFKRYSFHLTVLIAFLLWSAPNFLHFFFDKSGRFVHVGESPAMMFDQKTAQLCWAGPPESEAQKQPPAPEDSWAAAFGKHNGLPFCKDLR